MTTKECERCSTREWGVLLSSLLGHGLADFLSEATAEELSSDEAVAMVYRELRSLVRLKTEVESLRPQSDGLGAANSALVHFAKRLFLAAHQALLNSIEAETEKEHTERDLSGELRDTRKFLIEWQLVRLRAARERLVARLFELAEEDQQLIGQLNLPTAIRAQVESVRAEKGSAVLRLSPELSHGWL